MEFEQQNVLDFLFFRVADPLTYIWQSRFIIPLAHFELGSQNNSADTDLNQTTLYYFHFSELDLPD